MSMVLIPRDQFRFMQAIILVLVILLLAVSWGSFFMMHDLRTDIDREVRALEREMARERVPSSTEYHFYENSKANIQQFPDAKYDIELKAADKEPKQEKKSENKAGK